MKLGLSFVLVAMSVASLTIFGWVFDSGKLSVSARTPSLVASPSWAIAQGVSPSSNPEPDPLDAPASPSVRVQDAWRLVYEQLPDFPKENNYVSKESGKVDPNNTLVSRLIRYHVFVKGRPPNYRFDWKLTLADYLGATPDFLVETVYPGGDSLRENPMERDRAAIQRLNRAQRDALIQVLVNVFNGTSSHSATPTGVPPERSTSPVPQQPQPGDARLLMP